MNLTQIKKKLNKFGEKQLSAFDFYYECRKRNIKIYEYPMNVNGITSWQNDLTIISINSELSEFERLKTMWHEFAHAILHLSKTNAGVLFCDSTINSPAETEADMFAICAILPLSWLKTKTESDLIDEGFNFEMILERKNIYNTYKI